MFGTVFLFELKRLAGKLSTYVFFGILVLASFFLALIAGGAFKDANMQFAGEKIFANAPIVIDAFYSAIANYLGLIIVVAIVGNAVLKDFVFNTYSMLYTTPINKFDYLLGRFMATMLIVVVLMIGPAIGMMLGFASPWENPDKIEAFRLMPYITVYWQTVIPNIILGGAIFFAVSLIARDIFVIWLSLVIFFVGIGISNSFFGSLELRTIAAYVDPLGMAAKRVQGRYWSTYDKNHLMYLLNGVFLINRLIWLAISALIWFIGYSIFSFSSSPRRLSFRKPKVFEHAASLFAPFVFNRNKLPKVHLKFGNTVYLKNLWGLSVNECKTLLRNTYFRIIILFGMLLLFMASTQIGKIYDTVTYPVTYEIIENLGGTFQIFIIVITIMFSGELVWRARDFRSSNILDALPVPNWVYYTSKLAGLMFIQTIMLLLIMVCGIIVQLFKGYTNLEIGLYFVYLFGFRLVDLWFLAMVAIFFQTLVSNKYVGYFTTVLFYLWNTVFASLLLKHNLFVFSSDPGVIYSSMNGFGNSVLPFFIFKIYWGAFSFCLAVLSTLFWSRGTDMGLMARIKESGRKEYRQSWMVVCLGVAAFIGCGSFIYYNTNILNKYQSDTDQEKAAARYEKTYKKYASIPQPKVTDVNLHIDLFPHTHSLHAEGIFMLKNKTTSAIDSVHILMNNTVKINKLDFSRGSKLVMDDADIDYRIYKLDAPLQPGDSIALNFNFDMKPKGFEHDFTGLSTPLDNGTFMNNTEILPHIGYSDQYELHDNNHRKKYGLGYRKTSNPINDTAEYNTNLFTPDADFINFECVLSTVPDQIAVAPGYLKGEWQENGRRYFHYKMDKPIMNFYAFMSAKYTVQKQQWNGINLEIYYQKGDEYNLHRMFNGMKKALDYYTTNFTPYQHKQVRILEFPRYQSFAQSFPNTIPFSESIGFIADVDDSSKLDVDYPFYVTAHEVAHQWFAHQVIGANVEGSNIMSESLAQYGAIMVMEKEYGQEKISRFLKLEMDKYLTARSNDPEKEKPLALADISQQYIFYQKGGIVMHALNKYIGADSLNHALKHFIERYAFNAPPYPTTNNMLDFIRAATPDSMQYFITDCFQKITIYDNKMKDVQVTPVNGKFQVDMTVDCGKYYADSTGKETVAPMNDYIEVAAYKPKGVMMQLFRYKLKSGETKLRLMFDEKPYRMVIDPRFLLIDKKPDDNEFRVGATDAPKA